MLNRYLFFIINCLLLLSTIQCGRYEEEYDESIENEQITAIAEEAKLYFDTILNQNFLNYDATVNEIYILIVAVNDLSTVVIKLSKLLMDDTSNCDEHYHRIKIELDKQKPENHSSGIEEDVKKIAPNVKFTGDPEDIETLKEALQSTSQTSSSAQNLMRSLLDAQKGNLQGVVDNAFKVHSLQYALEHDQEALMNEELFLESCRKKNNTLNVMKHQMNENVERMENLRRETQQETSVITASSINLKTDFIELGEGKFTCKINIDEENSKLTKYLSLDEIDDQIKIIGVMQAELMSNVPRQLQDVDNVREAVTDLLTRINDHITYLEAISEKLQNQQNEYYKLLIKALEENDYSSARKYLSYLSDIKKAKKAIRKEYKRSNKNFEETLKACERIKDFGAKIAAIDWLYKEAERSKRDLYQYIYELFAHEVNMYYDPNTDYFSKEIPFLISKVHYTNEAVTLNMLLTMQRQLDRRQFLLKKKETWKSEVFLFLDSNFNLIAKAKCNPNLYAPLKRRKEEYMIFTIVSLEIFSQMMKHNNDVRNKLADLKIIMLAYWRNPEYLNEIEFCKNLNTAE